MQNLSIVHIIKDEYVEKINSLAEILGKGPNNLSVKLKDESGNIYWGCHSWWEKEAYAQFKDRNVLSYLGIDINFFNDSLDNLIESVVDTELLLDFSPLTDNWGKVLLEYNLIMDNQEEV